MTNLNGKSLDILQENIHSLKQLFPEVDCDGKIDFDKLKQILGEYTEDSVERYNFTWNGKGRALRLSQTPSQGTLRPCKEESKDWDTSQNLYIEGDNLEVLKLLQKSYHGKVKMIYIVIRSLIENSFLSIYRMKRVCKDEYLEGCILSILR